MSTNQRQEAKTRATRRQDAVQVLLFALALLLPSAGYLLEWNDFEMLAENRRLAERPDWPADASALREFPTAFERHFDDHFGFRSFLVGRDKRLEWLGRRTDVEIQLGEGGWLFQGTRRTTAEMSCMQPTEAVLASWLALGRDRRSRFEEVDIPFYWVMAPNKHTVHPEQLPVFARAELRECDVDALGQAFARAGVPFLDLRTQLVELPHDPPLYYQTDTHWNQLGAAHAVALLIEEIRRQFPAVPPFSFEPFDVAVGPELFEGNLAARLRVYGEHYEEPFLRLERRSPPTARLDPMQDPIDLRVHSREDPVLEFSTGRAELPTAWVFHDSFGFATMELLAEHFKSVRFVNSHGWIDAGHFERELPDLVIALFVENRIQEAARFEPDWRIKRDLVQVR